MLWGRASIGSARRHLPPMRAHSTTQHCRSGFFRAKSNTPCHEQTNKQQANNPFFPFILQQKNTLSLLSTTTSRHHDFYDHGPQPKGRHYDLPSISVSLEERRIINRTSFASSLTHTVVVVVIISQCLAACSDDVGRAAADSFRLQVRRLIINNKDKKRSTMA